MWILPQLFFCPWLAPVLGFLFGLPLSFFLPCLSHLCEDFTWCLVGLFCFLDEMAHLLVSSYQSVDVSVLVGLLVQPFLQLAVYGYPDALLGTSVSSLAEFVLSCWFCHVLGLCASWLGWRVLLIRMSLLQTSPLAGRCWHRSNRQPLQSGWRGFSWLPSA